MVALLAGTIAFVVAFAICLFITPIVRRWAVKWDFVDRPAGAEHKRHTRVVPYGGGIAMTAAMLVPLVTGLIAAQVLSRFSPEALPWLTSRFPGWEHWVGGVVQKTPAAIALIGGALVLHIMGLIDDHRPMSAMLKLAIQFVVALVLTLGFGIRAGDMLGEIPAVLLTSVWIVVVTNAFNFMDNMDGLTAGVAGLTAVILAFAAFVAGQLFVPCLLMVVAGATLGFLIYNFPPASVFMGDSGSLVIGYMLAVAAVLTTYIYPGSQWTPFGLFVPVVAFAVPLYDFASVLIRRYRRGVSVFQADRGHFSHRLVMIGLSPTAAVLTIYLATTATSLTAILLPLVSWAGAVLIFGQCVCVVAIIAILESRHDDSE